jgi:hypothetical protein
MMIEQVRKLSISALIPDVTALFFCFWRNGVMKKCITVLTVLGLMLTVGGVAQAAPNLVITANPAVAAVVGQDVPYQGYLATSPELTPGVALTAELTYDGGGFGRGGAIFPWTVEGAGYELFPNWAQFWIQVASTEPPFDPLPNIVAGEHILVTLLGSGLAWGTEDMGLGKLQLTDYYENVIGTLYVVPEPATLAILGLGGLLLRRRVV